MCEGGLIGKTRERLRSLHFRRDRDWLQSWPSPPADGRPATQVWYALAGLRVAGDRPPGGAGAKHRRARWPPPLSISGVRSRSARSACPRTCARSTTHTVQPLAGSIKLQGILVPVVVRNDGDTFELVAGFTVSRRPRRAASPTCRSSSGDAVTEDAYGAHNITHADVGMT